ncbi:hypothetical protein SDC9_174371 [bioreactor metagenome]|uniref:Uncharacterized protein n=1 Tax=bioreactor metagenome TaxID=1076179 RepID=A0A645GJQ1_9ZZZZ
MVTVVPLSVVIFFWIDERNLENSSLLKLFLSSPMHNKKTTESLIVTYGIFGNLDSIIAIAMLKIRSLSDSCLLSPLVSRRVLKLSISNAITLTKPKKSHPKILALFQTSWAYLTL